MLRQICMRIRRKQTKGNSLRARASRTRTKVLIKNSQKRLVVSFSELLPIFVFVSSSMSSKVAGSKPVRQQTSVSMPMPSALSHMSVLSVRCAEATWVGRPSVMREAHTRRLQSTRSSPTRRSASSSSTIIMESCGTSSLSAMTMQSPLHLQAMGRLLRSGRHILPWCGVSANGEGQYAAIAHGT